MHDENEPAGDLIGRLRKLFPLLLAMYVPVALVIGAILVVHLFKGIPIRYFFIDPVAEFNAPMYIGLLSNLGILMWCAAASVCLFGSFLLFPEVEKREVSLFLLCSGLITSILMMDDLYLLHEEVLPDHLHVPQPLVFAGYGVLVLAYFYRFRRTILHTEYILLLISLVFFALSVFVDLFVTPEEFVLFAGVPGRHLIEDGFKLSGIVAWAVYQIGVCVQQVRPSFRPA